MKRNLFRFQKALMWIKNNTLDGNGIAINSREQIIYPEVTGYYIPTLLQWGERDLAISYTKYLCSIQKEDGSWYDPYGKAPYVFDSAQILKGLVSIRSILPEVDSNIIRGCDWILSNMQEDGRLVTPDRGAWGNDEDFCSELVHIYCLSPIKEAGELLERSDYIEASQKILNYYITQKRERIEKFSLLSHFYAYVMEGLYDMGEYELCRKSMERLEKYRNTRSGIPGLNDVPWICSTGLFQLALVWYKLGELEKGNSLFYYALSLQNETGGWYGSYPAPSLFARFYVGRKKPFYFPNEEISWAVKYFLDALLLKEKLEFEKMAPIFLEEIDETDGRYELVRDRIKIEVANLESKSIKICDVGCGKGRYLKRLIVDCPQNEYFACDLSENVMRNIPNQIMKKTGSLTQIDYTDNEFDFVYTCEAYEHAINIRGAFFELMRIVKRGGLLVIIDKPVEKQGYMELYEWEQWISDDDIRRFTEEVGGELEIIEKVSYENRDDGLFRAWIVRKN